MPTERDIGRIWDILNCIKVIRNFVSDMTYPEFLDDKRTQDAVIHNVQIIGEAASKLSKEFKEQVKSVEWDDSIKMRHIIVHDYGEVRLDIIWDTVKHDLPQLEAALKPWLPEIE